ncbi:MAG: VOC family protein [Chloroflexota bacterium]
MPTVIRPHHVGIQVADLERSIAFYRDLLGFELLFQWNPQSEYVRTVTGYPDADIHAAVLAFPGDTGVTLEILEYRGVEKTPVDTRTANPGTAHIALVVDDCDALFAELTARQVPSVSRPVMPTVGPNAGGRIVYVIDPDGIRVELISTRRAVTEFSQEEATLASERAG